MPVINTESRLIRLVSGDHKFAITLTKSALFVPMFFIDPVISSLSGYTSTNGSSINSTLVVGGKTNFDSIRELYDAHGYQLPNIVFWNVNGRVGNVPATKTDKGIGLVSGFSPAILKAILAGRDYTPVDLMVEAINNVRYKPVRAALSK